MNKFSILVRLMCLSIGACAILSGCQRSAEAPQIEASQLTLPGPLPSGTNVCADDADWNDPATPQNIFGNTWYVGTCGLSAILITSPEGHVLIDGATEVAGPLIEANILALDFRLEDVHSLLISHEHHDHAGGIAYLQRVTGATVYARAPADAVLMSGKSTREDPQFLALTPMSPVAAVTRLDIDQSLHTGSLTLESHATPGHTPGGTSWTWTSCDKSVCHQMAYIDSLTPMSDDEFKYGDDSEHLGYLAAFRHGLSKIATLPCDILLTPHPSASDMWARLGAKPTAELVNPSACSSYAASASAKLDARVANEQQIR